MHHTGSTASAARMCANGDDYIPAGITSITPTNSDTGCTLLLMHRHCLFCACSVFALSAYGCAVVQLEVQDTLKEPPGEHSIACQWSLAWSVWHGQLGPCVLSIQPWNDSASSIHGESSKRHAESTDSQFHGSPPLAPPARRCHLRMACAASAFYPVNRNPPWVLCTHVSCRG